MKVSHIFVALKYQLPTADNFIYGQSAKCQELLNTYPEEVISAWAWRCAEDVEHLATTKETKEVYRVARLFRDGKASREELDTAYNVDLAAAYYAAAAAYSAAYATYAATYYAAYCGAALARARETKWNQYRLWLIEELCKYEEKK